MQGDDCVPVRPIRDRLSAERFYDYRLPRKYATDANGASVGDTALYASAGTTALQQAQTSLIFLYQGPEGLNLVVVHGSVHASDGGSVTFRISGLPEDGEWVVKDDRYRNSDTGEIASTNYDRWRTDGTRHRIDWTWGSGGTDGGAFHDLGDDFEVVVDPAFNRAAALYDEHYEGRVTDWEFLSGPSDAPERISLDMDEPIRIATGSCGGDTSDQQTGRQEREDDRDENEESREKYTVCHRPPGNPDNAHTIHVGSKSALEAHLAHGDERGPCPGDK